MNKKGTLQKVSGALTTTPEDAYAHAATSDSTREAYKRDIRDYLNEVRPEPW